MITARTTRIGLGQFARSGFEASTGPLVGKNQYPLVARGESAEGAVWALAQELEDYLLSIRAETKQKVEKIVEMLEEDLANGYPPGPAEATRQVKWVIDRLRHEFGLETEPTS